ncbi:hypothetical protein BDR04DRAFT_1101090 [Suillus decipiens]|nr:hypothetical protein BDR04DRAFT_1101090 [Suillus decipiens]
MGKIIHVSISTVTQNPAMRMTQTQLMITHGNTLVQANTRIINLSTVPSYTWSHTDPPHVQRTTGCMSANTPSGASPSSNSNEDTTK